MLYTNKYRRWRERSTKWWATLTRTRFVVNRSVKEGGFDQSLLKSHFELLLRSLRVAPVWSSASGCLSFIKTACCISLVKMTQEVTGLRTFMGVSAKTVTDVACKSALLLVSDRLHSTKDYGPSLSVLQVNSSAPRPYFQAWSAMEAKPTPADDMSATTMIKINVFLDDLKLSLLLALCLLRCELLLLIIPWRGFICLAIGERVPQSRLD